MPHILYYLVCPLLYDTSLGSWYTFQGILRKVSPNQLTCESDEYWFASLQTIQLSGTINTSPLLEELFE